MNPAHEIYVQSILARNNLLVYASGLILVFGTTGALANGKIKSIYTWFIVALYYVTLALSLIYVINSG